MRQAGGSLLREEVAEGDALLRLSAPAGRYTLTVSDEKGRTASLAIDLRAADPPPVFELPLPAAEPR